MFIFGFLTAWTMLGLFFYLRDSKGGWSIWETKWDTIVMILPAIPVVFLMEIFQEKVFKK